MLEIVDPSYFKVQSRLDAVRKAKAQQKVKKHGTVGCVARDKSGSIAAGTSTGGMTNKRWNRIGDSPIIGAGTYANNNTCGVSSTGHGEYFIRYAVAHDISALMDYKGMSLEEASNHVINEKLKEAGGEGGVICVDKDGNISTPHNTPGMYRGYATDKSRGVAIYGDEELQKVEQ
jgi:beta-aspartyl-peptidase (threonine type)